MTIPDSNPNLDFQMYRNQDFSRIAPKM